METLPLTAADLLAIMREVRDANSFELSPHDAVPGCTSGVCRCRRATRIGAAWRAFHRALAAGGIPPLADAVIR